MSGTEGSADPAESGADTTSDGLLPGSSNQVGLASYFTRPDTNPIQTHTEIEAEFQTVLDGVQSDNISFPLGVNMDFEHGSAPTSTLEDDAEEMMEAVHVSAAIRAGSSLVYGTQMMKHVKKLSM